MSGDSDEKRDLVDKHEVNGKGNITMSGHDIRWDAVGPRRDMRGRSIDSLALEATKVGAVNGCGIVDISGGGEWQS